MFLNKIMTPTDIYSYNCKYSYKFSHNCENIQVCIYFLINKCLN